MNVYMFWWILCKDYRFCFHADKYFDTIYYTCLKIEGKKKFKHFITNPFDETNKCKKNKGAIKVR